MINLFKFFFYNDSERILELKMGLEEAKKILGVEGPNGSNKAYTLIKDVLARYEEDLKFLTAGTHKIGAFEFLKD